MCCKLQTSFRGARCQDRLSYVQHLEASAPLSKLAPEGGRWPANVQPSLLRMKLCAGSNKLSSTLQPSPSADGLAVWDRPPVPSAGGGATSSNPAAWQFGLALLHASHAGPTGLPSAVQPLRCVARCCIFDRKHHRFLGNVHSMPAADVRAHKGLAGSMGACWTWDSRGPQGGPGPGPDGSITDLAGQQEPQLQDPVAPAALVGTAGLQGQGTGCGMGGAAAAAEAAAAAAGHTLADAVGSSSSSSRGSTLGGLGGHNACIVRCAGVAADPVTGLRQLDGEQLSLYVELNVAARLVAEDADVVPQDEALGAGLVDEVTTCWALISMTRCAELVRAMTISVPLYTGSIYEPVLLSSLWAEKRRQHPLRSMFSGLPSPQLTFRAGPLPARPPLLLPYRLMPHTLIARRDMACLLAAARLAAAEHHMWGADVVPPMSSSIHAAVRDVAEGPGAAAPQQACSVIGEDGDEADDDAPAVAAAAAAAVAACVASCGDAALAALPALLDDGVLQRELLAKWHARLRGLRQAAEDEVQEDCCLMSGGGCSSTSMGGGGPALPRVQQLVEALRLSALELAPLLHCASLPPPHVGNFAEHTAHRAAVAARFCRRVGPGHGHEGNACAAAVQWLRSTSEGRHPVEVFSRAHGEFVHQPFDVAETRVCVADALAAGSGRWSRC